jgi:hypothetical protein
MIRKNYLSTCTQAFRLAFGPVFNSPEGSAGTAIPDTQQDIVNQEPAEPEPTNIDDSGQEFQADEMQEPVDEIKDYIGNEYVNPQRRPLKNFDRSDLTKQDIDEMLAVSGEEMFMPPDKVDVKEEKEEKPEAKDENTEQKPEKTDKKTEKEPEKPVEFDEEEFFQHFDTSQEEFAALPEKLQEKMYDNFNSVKNVDVSSNEQYLELKNQLEEQQNNIKEFMDDPYVAARLEEIQTGKDYIARELPGATPEEINVLKAAETEADFNKQINKMLETRAQQAIANERTAANRRSYQEKSMIKASKIFSEVAKIDTRLSGDIKTENWNDIKPGHPDYKEYTKGPKKIVDYCVSKGIKLEAIAKLSPKELYAAIAAHEGWDKIRDKNIEKTVRSQFLAKIRKGYKQAKEVGTGRRSSAPMSGKVQTGVSRESLVEQLVSGDSRGFDKLLVAADGNPERLSWLEGIQQEAIRKGRELRRNN